MTTRSGRQVKKPTRLTYDVISLNLSYDEASTIIARVLTTVGRNDEYRIGKDYPFNKAKKLFGDKANKSAYKEFEQIHLRKTFKPVDPQKMTREESEKVLRSIVLTKMKDTGECKTRTVADGSQQRGTMSDEEKASPTARLEFILLTAIIEAKQRRDVAVLDVPNAFLHSDLPENQRVIMTLTGELAEIMVSIAPSIYRPYIITRNGKKMLFVELQKALYGLLQAALLFYEKLSADLQEYGFKINPYDPCVANKDVNGKQMTVVWHVDDLKVSHQDPKQVDKFIEFLRSKYEDDTGKVKVNRGTRHKYLGMTLDYGTPGSVKIDMCDYVEMVIKEFPEEITGVARTPAADHLFRVNVGEQKLDALKAEQFHTTVAKCLFLCKRARPDIQVAVAFLCTRVKEPDQDDWKKLVRLVQYLNGTKSLNLTLTASNSNDVEWWVDSSYAVHPDFKSHTGIAMSMGKGTPIASSHKQKMNTISSTEAELVGASEATQYILWVNNFLKEQGYSVGVPNLYQDNKSAILLEKNGMRSSSKRSRHINIRYFFIADCVQKKQLAVKYCPTNDMLADFFTKPLQGQKFIKFRNLILNIE